MIDVFRRRTLDVFVDEEDGGFGFRARDNDDRIAIETVRSALP